MRASRSRLTGTLRSAQKPTQEQLHRFEEFLARTYRRKVPLAWEEDADLRSGFRLQVGSDVYDWTLDGRIRQFTDYLRQLQPGENDLLPLMRQAAEDWSLAVIPEEIGEVLTVDGEIAAVGGLEHAQYGEILLFASGVKGMVMDLRRGELRCILFGSGEEVCAGSMVRRTLKTAGMPVGEGFLGRVVDALGVPVDGKGKIIAEAYRPIETPAPGILDRQPVNTPMETGLLAIDSMFPIGRGQRELIIGDRQTGKTAIALDTILNQKGKDVVCIYVAIGQKTSSVAQLVENLSRRGAMAYTCVINAPAGASAALQYVAPYAGCALGEHFMGQGRDVLIVYDDLSKQAVAYRQMSLTLRRPPGREAYPGDVFYLHSRLLERAVKMSDENGGGSMTALPIIETQAGDVSAYIPTNVISITDGQIFLQTDLFFQGQRPAVDVGISVSRVGGSAQIKAMKQVAGSLRLDLASYRELQAFTQFGSDLDKATQDQLTRGSHMTELLKQGRYNPMPVAEQVVSIYAGNEGYLDDLPLDDVVRFRTELLDTIRAQKPQIFESIMTEKKLTDEIKASLNDAISAFKQSFVPTA